MTIIDQLRNVIRDSGESEYRIAQATGVSASVLSRFVNGKRGITLEVAAKICEYLNLHLEQRNGP